MQRRRLSRLLTVGPLNARGERRRGSGIATRSGHWWPSAGILVRADSMAGEIEVPVPGAPVPVVPATASTLPTVTRDQIRTDRELVMAAARQPGGVAVLDESGRRQFTLWIPSEPIGCDDPID